MMNPRSIREGVALAGTSIVCDGIGVKALSSIVSIQLWPFYSSDGPASGYCDIRFEDGSVLRILSMGSSGAITRDRDLAYAAFLRSLHASFDGNARARIAFLDGIQSAGGLIAVALLFGVPVAVLSLYGAATRGAVWLLGLVPATAATAAMMVWYRKRPKPNVYDPNDLPASFLPPSD